MMTTSIKLFKKLLAPLRMLTTPIFPLSAAKDLPISMSQSTSATLPEPTTSDTLSIAHSHWRRIFVVSLPFEMTHWRRQKLGLANSIRLSKWLLITVQVAMVVEEDISQNTSLHSISLHSLLGISSKRPSICSFRRWSTEYPNGERHSVPQTRTS